MQKIEFLKQILAHLKSPSNESLKLSMADTHNKGIFSLVVSGVEFGKLTRIFISDTKLKPYEVQLHTHRYPIRLTTIKGNIKHYLAKEVDYVDSTIVSLSEFEYKSPLNGGNGLKYLKETNVSIKDFSIPNGSTIEMATTEFHTMSCSMGSIWIVEELGFETESSRVLGIPFVTDGLYNPPAPFQVNDKCQLVAREIKKILLNYELV